MANKAAGADSRMDDTGFTPDGTFANDNELHDGGMILLQER
jgi:hypothetical protein